MNDVVSIAARFQPATQGIASAEPYGSGNINDTFLVQLGGEGPAEFILQRINQRVFTRPHLIMANLRVVMRHVTAKAAALPGDARWQLPSIVPTLDGEDYYVDEEGGFWRALTFIEAARTYPKINDSRHAAEAGYALGRFQEQISDLDVALLHDTLPGFHIMPTYLCRYDNVLHTSAVDLNAPEIRYGIDFVAARRAWAPVLQNACKAGMLAERPMHGDPKIDNIMIDDVSGRAVSIIDLDTVKPGLVQYDIGDCLRSCCNPLGEDAEAIDQVTFEPDLCETILKGYLPQVRTFYTAHDYALLFDSVRVLAFEMGLRFFTDHLAGDVYFKVRYRGHNLMRALVQFRLMESIEAQEPAIRRMIASLCEV